MGGHPGFAALPEPARAFYAVFIKAAIDLGTVFGCGLVGAGYGLSASLQPATVNQEPGITR